jgi:hypothetical protein
MQSPSIYDKYLFENKNDAMSAGYSCMTKPKYNTLVIPVGLVLNHHTENSESHDSTEDEEPLFPVVRSDKFDTLFYSIGKNLGKPRATTLKKQRTSLS